MGQESKYFYTDLLVTGILNDSKKKKMTRIPQKAVLRLLEQNQWTTKYSSRSNMDNHMLVVIPRWKSEPSIITLAIVVLEKWTNITVDARVDANVDGLTNQERTDKQTEIRIPISRHANAGATKMGAFKIGLIEHSSVFMCFSNKTHKHNMCLPVTCRSMMKNPSDNFIGQSKTYETHHYRFYSLEIPSPWCKSSVDTWV